MKIKRHHFYTLILTLVMLLGALALLFVNEWLGKQANPKVEVREVHVATLPPPPPPPPAPAPAQVQPVEQVIDLSIDGEGPLIEAAIVKIEQPTMSLTPPPMTMKTAIDFSHALDVDWQAFGLDQLDDIPKLLTRAKTQYPSALTRKGVVKTTVKLDVFIDKAGKPALISATGQYHQHLKSSIARLIKRSRFSSPTKNGTPVAARFVWPVEFSKT